MFRRHSPGRAAIDAEAVDTLPPSAEAARHYRPGGCFLLPPYPGKTKSMHKVYTRDQLLPPWGLKSAHTRKGSKSPHNRR